MFRRANGGIRSPQLERTSFARKAIPVSQLVSEPANAKVRSPRSATKVTARPLSGPPTSSLLAGCALLAATVWAYWPTLMEMVRQWNLQPDYSHGYLVAPIAAYFLWIRRNSLPREKLRPSFWGIGLLAAAGGLRLVAGMYFLLPLDGWTLPLTVAGCVWLAFGWHCLRWSLPSIVFLWFMVPIPYRVESWLSVPLQGLATKLSTAMLVFLGQPAVAEGHTILLGEHSLGVEEACSGLRICVGIFALAFAFVLFSTWRWWQKALVVVAALPIAVLANSLRIVATGLLYQIASSDVAEKFSHDLAGFVMIPVAAAIFWLLLLYMDAVYSEVEEVSPISGVKS